MPLSPLHEYPIVAVVKEQISYRFLCSRLVIPKNFQISYSESL